VERGRIVNAVAHEPHGVAVVFESQENPVFLRGRYAREYPCLLDIVPQRRVGHPLQFVARQDVAGGDT
jgi:hypothetical protein